MYKQLFYISTFADGVVSTCVSVYLSVYFGILFFSSVCFSSSTRRLLHPHALPSLPLAHGIEVRLTKHIPRPPTNPLRIKPPSAASTLRSPPPPRAT